MALAAQSEGAQSPWHWGDRIRKARREPLNGKGRYSQEEIAELVGVTVRQWSNWEAGISGARNLTQVAQKVSLVTGYPVMWLLGVGPEGIEPSTVGFDGDIIPGHRHWLTRSHLATVDSGYAAPQLPGIDWTGSRAGIRALDSLPPD